MWFKEHRLLISRMSKYVVIFPWILNLFTLNELESFESTRKNPPRCSILRRIHIASILQTFLATISHFLTKSKVYHIVHCVLPENICQYIVALWENSGEKVSFTIRHILQKSRYKGTFRTTISLRRLTLEIVEVAELFQKSMKIANWNKGNECVTVKWRRGSRNRTWIGWDAEWSVLFIWSVRWSMILQMRILSALSEIM